MDDLKKKTLTNYHKSIRAMTLELIGIYRDEEFL